MAIKVFHEISAEMKARMCFKISCYMCIFNIWCNIFYIHFYCVEYTEWKDMIFTQIALFWMLTYYKGHHNTHLGYVMTKMGYLDMIDTGSRL